MNIVQPESSSILGTGLVKLIAFAGLAIANVAMIAISRASDSSLISTANGIINSPIIPQQPVYVNPVPIIPPQQVVVPKPIIQQPVFQQPSVQQYVQPAPVVQMPNPVYQNQIVQYVPQQNQYIPQQRIIPVCTDECQWYSPIISSDPRSIPYVTNTNKSYGYGYEYGYS